MSATLGPIHYWMYDKIRLREELIASLVDLAKRQNYDEDPDGFPLESYARRELPPIEEAIDLSRIHASLSGQIDGVERRYAQLITSLLCPSCLRGQSNHGLPGDERCAFGRYAL